MHRRRKRRRNQPVRVPRHRVSWKWAGVARLACLASRLSPLPIHISLVQVAFEPSEKRGSTSLPPETFLIHIPKPGPGLNRLNHPDQPNCSRVGAAIRKRRRRFSSWKIRFRVEELWSAGTRDDNTCECSKDLAGGSAIAFAGSNLGREPSMAI